MSAFEDPGTLSGVHYVLASCLRWIRQNHPELVIKPGQDRVTPALTFDISGVAEVEKQGFSRGDVVTIEFRDMGNVHHAQRIRLLSLAPSGVGR